MVPLLRVAVVKDQAPVPSALAVSSEVPALRTVAVLLASAVPASTSTVSLVLPPLATVPVTVETSSVTEVMEGAVGATASTDVAVQVTEAQSIAAGMATLLAVALFALTANRTVKLVPLVVAGDVSFAVPTAVAPPAVPCQAQRFRPPLEKLGSNWAGLNVSAKVAVLLAGLPASRLVLRL